MPHGGVLLQEGSGGNKIAPFLGKPLKKSSQSNVEHGV